MLDAKAQFIHMDILYCHIYCATLKCCPCLASSHLEGRVTARTAQGCNPKGALFLTQWFRIAWQVRV
jgi:hypothetical protein